MNKNIIALAFIALFSVTYSIMPQAAHASYNSYNNSYGDRDRGGYNHGGSGSYNGGSNFTNPYTPSNNTYINNYTYTTPQYVNPYPVIQQPVYIPAPQPIVYQQPIYQQPVYQYQQPIYNPLTISCSANTSYTNIGQTVTWNTSVYGGAGYYTYSWSGSDSVYGSNSSLQVSYNSPGQKYATVTVYSNGQSATQQCSNTVTVGGQAYGYAPLPITGEFAVGCAADTASARIGAPVKWSVEAVGGAAPYTYSWSGSEGLSGSQTSVSTSYDRVGQKTASVTVRGADGVTIVKECKAISVYSGSTVNNGGNNNGAGGSATVVGKATTTNADNSSLSAASLFSLGNIPWGWVALLIILILIGVIMYLVFNRHKV